MASQKLLPLATLGTFMLGASVGCSGTIIAPDNGSSGSGANGSGSGNGSSGNGSGNGNGNLPGGTGNGSPGTGSSTPPGGTTPPGGIIPPGGGSVGSGSTTPADPNTAGTMPLLRMTRREYNNTVRDLLLDTSNPADAFPLDRESEFLFRRAGLVSSQDLETMRDAAQTIAAGIESKAQSLAPCAAGADETACAKKFVTSFGLRTFRRPLSTDDTDRLMTLYQTGRGTLALTYAGGIRLLVEGMLQSPSFFYHWELGNSAPTLEGALIRLNAYETASRMSYFIWGSMPDQALFDAAAGNKLGTVAELEAQATRMLADGKARDTVAAFADEWLNLDQINDRPKDPAVYPEFKDDLKAAMASEMRAFIAGVVTDGDSRLSSLLMATSTFVNQPLAAVYGLSGVTGTAMKPMTLSATERAGLLTRAEFLTVTGSTDGSHPVKRGRRIYERLLCGQLPPPPNDVPPAQPASAGGTTRERFEAHDKNPCTGACHGIMDGLGYGFEHYDGIGRYRTTDNGGPVDSRGKVDLDGGSHDFADARELSQLLAASPTVARCFATQWLRYTFKRIETESDRASLDAVTAALGRGNSIKDMLVGIVGTKSFRYRTPSNGEKLQ
jgi:hypothetical protein